jgi:hypothetical protein
MKNEFCSSARVHIPASSDTALGATGEAVLKTVFKKIGQTGCSLRSVNMNGLEAESSLGSYEMI